MCSQNTPWLTSIDTDGTDDTNATLGTDDTHVNDDTSATDVTYVTDDRWLLQQHAHQNL